MPAKLNPEAPVAGFVTSRIRITADITTRVLDTGVPAGSDTDAPPVVLVHGVAASIEIWRDILPELAKHHRIVAFDLPGFGHSDKPDADYRAVPFFIPMLGHFLDAAGIERAHFVGSSLGASLVLRYGVRNTDRIVTATMANPGGFGRSIHPFLRVPTVPGIGTIISKPQRPTNAFGVRIAVHRKENRTRALVDETDAFSRLPGTHRAFVRTLRGIATPFTVKELDIFEDEARRFDKADIPTLVVWGRQDKIFPVKQIEAVRTFMPGAHLEVIDQVGHYPQVDAPTEFTKMVLKHLRKA